MFKVKIGLVPHYFGEMFDTASKGCSLRNADFNIPAAFQNNTLW